MIGVETVHDVALTGPRTKPAEMNEPGMNVTRPNGILKEDADIPTSLSSEQSPRRSAPPTPHRWTARRFGDGAIRRRRARLFKVLRQMAGRKIGRDDRPVDRRESGRALPVAQGPVNRTPTVALECGARPMVTSAHPLEDDTHDFGVIGQVATGVAKNSVVIGWLSGHQDPIDDVLD
jgi:hypothetical protein